MQELKVPVSNYFDGIWLEYLFVISLSLSASTGYLRLSLKVLPVIVTGTVTYTNCLDIYLLSNVEKGFQETSGTGTGM